tara:strand:- start:91 stop:333 length:243 start_codon:yes stop_codon:yes gene_type:complete
MLVFAHLAQIHAAGDSKRLVYYAQTNYISKEPSDELHLVVPRFKAAERQGRYDVFAAPSEEGARRIFNEAREQRITKIVE